MKGILRLWIVVICLAFSALAMGAMTPVDSEGVSFSTFMGIPIVSLGSDTGFALLRIGSGDGILVFGQGWGLISIGWLSGGGDGSAPRSLSRAGIRRRLGCQLPDAILHGKRSCRPRSRAVQGVIRR